MKMNWIHIIKDGWPILSVLALFSILSLASFLQSVVLLSRARSALAAGDQPGVANALDTIEGRMALLGTIATAAPFVGLLGTVIGIIRAFHSIALNSGGGIVSVAGGISEALVATAAGLAVAIPASMIYNFFTHETNRTLKKAGLE
jgi:biopolymer transport protein ExbB/TolQ